MKLLFKQRFFSWFDSYDIYDEAGNTVYTVEGKLAWGHCLHILDADGNHIGTVQQKMLTFLPKFELYEHDQYIGCIQKEFTFFSPRFDIDCNDVTESTDADRQPVKDGFCSIHDGSMHACGHDGHASLGLHTCIALNEIKNDLCGTIKVIFQPAEEGVRGAQSIAEGGILDDVDYLLTGHLGMGWNTGSLVALSKGFLSTTKVDAEFKGVSAHAGMSPQDGKNAILAACSATLAMHTACQDSRGASRINVGTIQGGSGRNVVPADAMIRFETRGETADIQELVLKKAMNAVNGAAEMFDCSVDTKIMGSASSADSSAELEPFIRAGAARIPEITNYVKEAAFSGSEDATYLMAKVQSHGGKAAYMCIGSNIAAPHHNDHFNFDESSLLTGLRLYVSTVWEIMHR